MLEALKKNPKVTPRRGPVVLAILDGVGFGKYPDGDGVKLADRDGGGTEGRAVA